MMVTIRQYRARKGWSLWQWHSSRHPVDLYCGDHLVAEYEGRFKLLRAYLRMCWRKDER
jgi:hypothetical protein